MKKPWLAFVLSFVLPGAGLAYLGKWKWAFGNLGVVLFIGIVLAFLLEGTAAEGVIRFIGIGLSAGSGAYAEFTAKQLNKEADKAVPRS
jgi:hypothetical protein